jgi:hypothetical protein
MLNPEDYGHFFDVVTHVNFAGVALLTFFYDKIHKHLVNEFSDAAIDAEVAKDLIDEIHGLKVSNKNAQENYDNAKKWIWAKWKLRLLTPIIKITNSRLTQINTEVDYILKYLPR